MRQFAGIPDADIIRIQAGLQIGRVLKRQDGIGDRKGIQESRRIRQRHVVLDGHVIPRHRQPALAPDILVRPASRIGRGVHAGIDDGILDGHRCIRRRAYRIGPRQQAQTHRLVTLL